MKSTAIIRQAVQSDTSAIAGFLSHAAYIHRHLDWQGVLEWIPYQPFLILQNENRLHGLLVCPPDLEKISWIRCFACSQYNELSQSWNSLLNEVCHFSPFSGTSLYSVGLNDWFAQLLKNSGFENFQNIVVLLWKPRPLDNHHFTDSWWIRPMETSDLPQVALLDHIAFESMWVNPADKINLAYTQSEHASVAELDGRIIGYEMTTANHFSAHLARIAVHPDFRQKHIGARLIIEMIKYFKRKGIDQISVNTQSSNTSSLALYTSLGFELTGESFPVFRFLI